MDCKITKNDLEPLLGGWVDIPQRTHLPRPWICRCTHCGCPSDYKHNFCPNCGQPKTERALELILELTGEKLEMGILRSKE